MVKLLKWQNFHFFFEHEKRQMLKSYKLHKGVNNVKIERLQRKNKSMSNEMNIR